MGVVAVVTGTIYDQNDGKPIFATISASLGQSQVYNKDEGSISWLPNYAGGTPNRLTAIVNVAGSDVVGVMSQKKWGTSKGASDLGTGAYIDVATNQDPATATQRVFYFEGIYTDPTTLIPTTVYCQITLSVLKTGTNAVYILLSGQKVIKKAADGTRNTAELKCDLVRSSGVDDTGITYKWFKYPYAVADQIDANHADIAKFSFKTTAGGAAAVPADGTWADVKSIIIREDAVATVGLFKVQAKDADGIVYEQVFDITDMSDLYQMIPYLPDGNVMLAGQGSKRIIPVVWYGSAQIDITNYTFKWGLNDRFGNKSGYIDTDKTSSAKAISANTAGITGNFTHGALGAPLVAGDVIRAISADGTIIRSYEVGSGSTTVNTVIRSPQNGFSAVAPSLNEFAGGKLWVYKGNGAAAGFKDTTGSAAFTVTSDDNDGLCVWTCQVTNPLVA